MRYVFYCTIGLFLTMLQTSVLPFFTIFKMGYDLLIPFILFLSIFCPATESIIMVLILGFVMDNLSEVPFGLYLTTYIWLYAGMRRMRRVLQMGNIFVMIIVVISGVLIENFIGVMAFAKNLKIPVYSAEIIGVQLLWAMSTGVFFLKSFGYGLQKWDIWVQYLFEKKS